MNKRDVLRLKPGTTIEFSSDHGRHLYVGIVEDVTPRGGVRVSHVRQAKFAHEPGSPFVQWVPYHHVAGVRP
jgi:hypothetical protein